MAKFEHFEDIQAWQKARSLANPIYEASALGEFAKDFVMRDQMRRAALSVVSNIAEGFERGGDKEFIQFLSLSKGSCGEVRAQLYIAGDQGYLSQSQLQSLLSQAAEVSRMISGLMHYLRQSEFRGSKFK